MATGFAEKADATLTGLAEDVRPQVDQGRDELASLNETVRAFIEERPLLALAGAVAAGFVAARLLARR